MVYSTSSRMNKNEPGKVRIVMDCAAQRKGRCLNNEVKQGPNLMNSLVGVLMRLRQYQYAFSSDIEYMYYLCKEDPIDRDVLRLS